MVSEKYIQVSSTGGASSTSFMKYFERYVPMNTHTFPPGQDVGMLKHQRAPGAHPAFWCPPHEHGAFHKDRSTFRIFNEISGAIFLYSDPRIVTASLFKRALIRVHLQNMGIPHRWNNFPEVHGENGEHIPCAIRADLTAYVYRGEDIFLLEKMIENWFKTPVPFPKLLVKCEHMFEYSREILDFLNLPASQPFLHQRKRTTDIENSEHLDGLNKMFEFFLPTYNALPPILKINPADQAEVTNMYKELRNDS